MMMISSKPDQNLVKNYLKLKKKTRNSQVLCTTTPSDFLIIIIIIIAIVKKKYKCVTSFFPFIHLVVTILPIHYLLIKEL